MTTPPLIRVSCKSGKEKIGLTNYSDLVIYDKEHSLVAIRLGGYPEMVQAMSDAILGGCELELTGNKETINVNSKGRHNFDRKIILCIEQGAGKPAGALKYITKGLVNDENPKKQISSSDRCPNTLCPGGSLWRTGM